ncbi:MAG: hypothetical protein AMJ43_10970 [Coxiella sp. DG_40]|nr:MAG: hypothetical protein AMJ43_10970 [Coxiella sp. DG_40]
MNSRTNTYLVVILLAAFIVIGWAKDENRDVEQGVTKETSTAEAQQQNSTETARRMWALGCSAVLVERNHGRHNLLGTDFRTPGNIQEMRDFLAQGSGWDIKNRLDLFDSLRWFDNGGNREKFGRLGRLLKTFNEQEYKEFLRKHESDQQMLQRIRVAKQYYEKLGSKSLLGWDYSRYICLCRWGYMAGYISEQEAWELIMPVARILQAAFDSWQDLGRNYIIGRSFWSYEKTIEEGHLFEDVYHRLVDMKSSPWNMYPWDMDLTGTQVISESNETDMAEKGGM